MGLQIVMIVVALFGMNMNLTEGTLVRTRSVVPSVTVSGTPNRNQSDLPVRGEIRQTYKLASNANIDVTGIEGPVEVETTSANTVELHFVREAKTQTDYDCETINIEDSAANLIVRHTTKKEPQCHIIQAREQLKLSVPRSANLTFSHIEGDFSVGATDGFLRLSWIEGSVRVGQAQAAAISWVEGNMSLNAAQVGPEGVKISYVEGSVELGVTDKVNADLRVSRHSGKVQISIPNAQTMKSGKHDYQLRLGAGGAQISISAIDGDVNIRSL